MTVIEIGKSVTLESGLYRAEVVLERGAVKVRRIELAEGAAIPPCRMAEDGVFVVLSGRVSFRAEGEEAVVAAPGAVFIPGGAATRSMEAREKSLVLAVLALRAADFPSGHSEEKRR